MTSAWMKRLGYLCLSVGFLSGSYVTVAQKAAVAWDHYAVAFAITFVGVVLARLGNRVTAEQAEKLGEDVSVIERTLDSLVETVSDLNTQRDESDVFELCHRIDKRCMDDINDFAEAREAFIHRFGLAKYAELMDNFALGERALNRAWCASADGYIDELHICLNRAETRLRAARNVVKDCLKAASPRRAVRDDAT